MLWRNTSTRYGAVAKGLHWVVGLLVIALVGVGLYMSDLPNSPAKFQIYGMHKAVGITVLGLVILRILWRFSSPRPAMLASYKPHEIWLAHLVHLVFYVCLLAMPLSGWVMSSAANFPVSVFGFFTLPMIVAPNPQLVDLMKDIHEVLGNVLIGAFVLHVAGALKHHFIDRDETLRRMLPFVAVFLFVPFAAPQAADDPLLRPWEIEPKESKLTFTAEQQGAAFDGSFGIFGGTIVFDPARLSDSKADIMIDIASAATGSPDRDSELQRPDWFDAAKFPTARFVADEFVKGDGETYIANGKLTLRDVTRPVALPFTLTIDHLPDGPDVAKVDGKLTLSRLDYGIGQDRWTDTSMVGASVDVTLKLTATRSARDRNIVPPSAR